VKHSTVVGEDGFTDIEWYDLVIVVITMNREGYNDGEQEMYIGYLTQTVARLLQIFHSDNTAAFRRKKLIMCSVDRQPQTFTEALDLSNIVQTVFRYRNNSAQRHDDVTRNIYEVEKNDYVYCLQTASRYASLHYLVLEDDVLLDENAIETLNFIMNYFDLFATTDWLFLKLFYPDKWSGYDRSWKTVLELGGYSMLGGCVCGVVVLMIPKHRKSSSSYQNLRLSFWFVVGAVFMALMCASIGRQYVESWRQYFASTHRLVAAPDCCTQATLYPAHVVSDLCAHLSRIHSDFDFAKDIAIDGFAHVRGLKRYLVQPNIVKHIGLISGLHRKSKTAEHFL